MKNSFFVLAVLVSLILSFGSRTAHAEEIPWEGFEGENKWVPAEWENIAQVELSLSTENVSEGKQSLKVVIKEEAIDWKNKVAFSKEDYLNLSDANVVMDVYSQAPSGIAVAVGFDTGSGWTYYESNQKAMKQGWNKDVTFDLSATSFKSRVSEWKYTQALADRDDIRRVHILFYRPSKMKEDVVYLDNIRFK